MAKKEIGLQFTVIVMLIGFCYWLITTDFLIEFPQLNAIIRAYELYFIITIVALGLIPVSNLILQIISRNHEEYNDKPYYAILKGISHLIFSTFIILILAVLFAYLWIYSSMLIPPVWLSFILACIVTLYIYFWLWRTLERKFGLKARGFFIYTSNL